VQPKVPPITFHRFREKAFNTSVVRVSVLRRAAQNIRLSLLAGAVAVCALGFVSSGSAAAAAAPTFNQEVAPILFKHCSNCHRPGEIGSAVSLISYEAARPWAASIKEQVVRREMPPWPADPAKSMKFRNDPRLSQKEIDTLVAWVDAGAPKGSGADVPPPSFPQGWLHPQGLAPDLVIPLREVHLPAKGEIPYVRYLGKIPFSQDKWVVALQVRPGNRALIHHMAITEIALANGVAPGDLDHLAQIARQLGLPSSGSIATQPAVIDPVNPAEYDMLAVYTPGTTVEMYPDDSAKLLKGGKNMYLNFNIHYQTTGQPETDQSMLGFWFRADPPKHQLYRVPAAGEAIIAGGKELLTDSPGEKAEGTRVAIPPIPPFAENYEVIGITAYTVPVTIYQLQPHAHLRGKDFQYIVVFPDGREESVLSVPKYDFHWQLAYELDEPLKLPAGSKLVVIAHYDNSLHNQHLQNHHGASDTAQNFGADKEVYFREANQSWDEMFTPFMQYSIDGQDLTQPSQSATAKAGEQEKQRAPNAAEIAEVVGCLGQDPSKAWILTKASEATASSAQATSGAEVKAAAAKPLGDRQYQLLGITVFNPAGDNGQKVAVKGVLIEDAKASRINVTSLQIAAPTCF
jgi:mono/diheme cytochrome c family protein